MEEQYGIIQSFKEKCDEVIVLIHIAEQAGYPVTQFELYEAMESEDDELPEIIHFLKDSEVIYDSHESDADGYYRCYRIDGNYTETANRLMDGRVQAS
jgi:hypothetical protein